MGVPVALIADRLLIARLMRANAVSPELAQPLDGLPWMQTRRLARLLAARVIREAEPSRFYVDAPTLVDHVTAQRRRAAIVLAVVLGIVALLYLL